MKSCYCVLHTHVCTCVLVHVYVCRGDMFSHSPTCVYSCSCHDIFCSSWSSTQPSRACAKNAASIAYSFSRPASPSLSLIHLSFSFK